MPGTSKVSPEQRTRVQMSPEAQNDIKMHFYDFYQINLYVFNKFQIYFINYSGLDPYSGNCGETKNWKVTRQFFYLFLCIFCIKFTNIITRI